MQSHYEINVSLKGVHLFATAPRSIQSEYQLSKVSKIIKEKFPESEGYEIRCTHWVGTGQSVEI